MVTTANSTMARGTYHTVARTSSTGRASCYCPSDCGTVRMDRPDLTFFVIIHHHAVAFSCVSFLSCFLFTFISLFLIPPSLSSLSFFISFSAGGLGWLVPCELWCSLPKESDIVPRSAVDGCGSSYLLEDSSNCCVSLFLFLVTMLRGEKRKQWNTAAVDDFSRQT